MSGSIACKCGEGKRPIDSRPWVIVVYKANYSRFNGSRWTPSAYSEIRCNGCGAIWRTKAAYVQKLRVPS